MHGLKKDYCRNKTGGLTSVRLDNKMSSENLKDIKNKKSLKRSYNKKRRQYHNKINHYNYVLNTSYGN